MKVGIASDHRGFKLKTQIIIFLKNAGHKVVDYGTNSETSVDYPDFALNVAHAVVKRRVKFGILLCYSGQGMAITANKVKGIRAAICTKPEIARLARAHNNANVLVIPAGFVRFSVNMQKTLGIFLTTKFEGGRHLRRYKLIKRYEDSAYCI